MMTSSQVMFFSAVRRQLLDRLRIDWRCLRT